MATTSSTFWDGIARKYATRPIGNQAAYEQSLERTRSYLGPEDKVLEFGAGTASTAMLLAPHVGHITASDFSAEMVAIGKEKVWNESLKNIEVVQAAPSNNPFPDESFDAVLALNLLHLLPALEEDLAAIYRKIRPGGLFISKTPCLHGKRFFVVPMVKIMQLVGKAPYLRVLSVDDADRLVKEAGFEIVETGLYPPTAPSRYIVARKPA